MDKQRQLHESIPGADKDDNKNTTTTTNSNSPGRISSLFGGWNTGKDASTGTAPATNGGVVVGSKAREFAGQLAFSAGQAMQHWTVKKYGLPDKNVASQVLMYRQLLHTACRPGLKLSREYQGTPAQKAVKHMPWWSEGMDTTGKMVIAYDNLVRRLWLHGAILAYSNDEEEKAGLIQTHLDNQQGMPPIPHEHWVARLGFQQPDPVTDFRSGGVLSLALLVWIVESCPHVFRRFVRPSGDASVLPFAITSINITDMMAKFLMLAKSVDRMDALLSQKPFWRMFADPNSLLACQELALDMLADVVVELRTERRAEQDDEEEEEVDISQAVVDKDDEGNAKGGETSKPIKVQSTMADVTVFDFAHILQVTEHRVSHDLLGAGPSSVDELRAIYERIKARYKQQSDQKVERIRQRRRKSRVNSIHKSLPQETSAQQSSSTAISSTDATNEQAGAPSNSIFLIKDKVLQRATDFGTVAGTAASGLGTAAGTAATGLGTAATGLGTKATSFAGSVFSKIKTPVPLFPLGGIATKRDKDSDTTEFSFEPVGNIPQEQQQPTTAAATTTANPAPAADAAGADAHPTKIEQVDVNMDADLLAAAAAVKTTDDMAQFSIGDEDDDEHEAAA